MKHYLNFLGQSDPYVTIQCGLSKIKRTKTQKKCLNPIWNETIEFEYTTTTEGILDEGNCGDKIIIRVWDEDIGLKVIFNYIFFDFYIEYLFGFATSQLNNGDFYR